MKPQKGADNNWSLSAIPKAQIEFNRIMPRNKLILFVNVNLEINNQWFQFLIIFKVLLTELRKCWSKRNIVVCANS
jgi:hypothetical protein